MTPAPRRRLAIAWVTVIVVAGVGVYLFKLDPRLWTLVGDRQLRRDRLVQAERSFQRALDIDVDHVPALYGLGWAYLRADLDAQARDRFQRSVDLAPEFHGGHRGLAAVERRTGESRSAEERLRRAYDLAPNDPGVVTDIAGVYMDAGYVDEGLGLFDRAIDLAPSRAEYRLARAEASLAAGRIDEARAQVEAARGLRTRNRRFAGAADELLVRAALLELDGLRIGGELAAGDCSAAISLVEAAEGHLDEAVEAGLEEDLARSDRKRLGKARRRVDADCAAQGALDPGSP